jgi:acyl-CoA synthetase (AMP-forming)/AMP-acid ligase II
MSTYNFSDLLQIVADTVPDRTALVHGAVELTYTELSQFADRIARVLVAKGVGANDNVGLQLTNSPEYLAAFFGACRIGAVPFNVNYRYSSAELSYLYEDSQVKALLFDSEFSDDVKEACKQGSSPEVLLEVGGARLGENLTEILESVLPDIDAVRHDHDQIIIYTGGTTGYPKGVIWPHKHLFFSALGGGGFFHADGAVTNPEELIGRVNDGTALTTMPLAPLMHGAALWTSLIALFAGHKVILSNRTNFDANHAWQLIRDHQVNIVSIVGDAMALPLIETLEQNRSKPAADNWALDHLFSIGSGGAVFSETLQQRFTALLPNLFVMSSLGATETGTVGASDVPTDEGIMRYAPRDDLSVIVDGRRLAERGEEGVLARSGMLPVGYFGDEKKTRESFLTIDGVQYALGGDAARLEEDSSITVLGRGSMCINSGGEKIFPEEVESTLKGYDAVDDVLVVGMPHKKWGQQVVAVYCANTDEVSENDLRNFCRASLAGYKVPKLFIRVENVQRNVVGKPDYKWAKSVAEQLQ